MDSTTNRNVALLSIHPEFANKIFDGSKSIELRRIKLRDEVQHVIVYVTSPIMKVVGYFDIEEIVEETPEFIWRTYGAVAGIDRERFFQYYDQRDLAVGIKIRRTHLLPRPKKLSFLSPKLTPPQSIQYLPFSTILKLRSANPEKRAA